MRMPSRDYLAAQTFSPAKLHGGLDRYLHDLLGRWRGGERTLRQMQLEAEAMVARSLELKVLSESRLRERVRELETEFRRRKKGYQMNLPSALTVLAEVAERTLGMRPYPVQVLGAMTIYGGGLAEMATGEGKSLTACFPAVLSAWTGRPCHVLTANDYLASRDAAEMVPFYSFCRVSVGWVGGEMDSLHRRNAYDMGVVYTTSKELLADFLRDRLLLAGDPNLGRLQSRNLILPRQFRTDALVMRGIDSVIVDEADSVLIDEAVTPLIVSQTKANQTLTEQACVAAARLADSLSHGSDYLVDLRNRHIHLTDEGREKIEAGGSDLQGIWRSGARRQELVVTSLAARELYRQGQQYVVENGKIVIVDEFTGRLMPQRSWQHGLHQALEVREGLSLSDPGETLARLSFQRFFRFFNKLGGISGTAREADRELWHVYSLPTLSIPTNRPCLRKLLATRVYLDLEGKRQAIADEVSRCRSLGQPVLVGMRNISESEALARVLEQRRIPFELLNAKRHAEEAQIVTGAGQRGAVTLATNMAGRGTDIKLGSAVAELGGLHVIVSERHEARRIDRQLIGRCARQGDPGSARVYVSLEDELFRRFTPEPVRLVLAAALAREVGGAAALVERTLALGQRAAERLAFQQRKSLLSMDDRLAESLSFARSELGC